MNDRIEMLERRIMNMEEQHAQEVQTMRDTIASFEERIKEMKLVMDQMASIPAVTEAQKMDTNQDQVLFHSNHPLAFHVRLNIGF